MANANSEPKNNPTFTLADGSKVRFSDLDWTSSEEHADLYWNHVLENDNDDDPIPSTSPASVQAKAPTPEEANAAALGKLEEEVAALKAKAAKKLTKDVWDELNAKSGELTDLRARAKKEASLKDSYRRKFKSSGLGTDADFQRLWTARIRDEALMDELAVEAKLRRAASHPIYQGW